MGQGALIGRTDRERSISEARSAGYAAGISWNGRPAATEELKEAMWLGAVAALFGVIVGACIRVWLNERRGEAAELLGGELSAAPLAVGLVGDSDATGELDPTPEEGEQS